MVVGRELSPALLWVTSRFPVNQFLVKGILIKTLRRFRPTQRLGFAWIRIVLGKQQFVRIRQMQKLWTELIRINYQVTNF